MTRALFSMAFLLGLAVVVWMAIDFVGENSLALIVTLVIGGVYLIGFLEQVQFKKATSTLDSALNQLKGPVNQLDQWVAQLDPSLQNSVRTRIEGERIPLPAPVLTPYLVGLLVMLGLLGTFAGMVVTLKGAVLALEGTTELQAIRAGLAAPIGGLGLAFGTSVAGVAASAMLGLISTLNRRERMVQAARLDSQIGQSFREHSLYFNRQETYKAMQTQAQALPLVAEQLQTLAQSLTSMGQNISSELAQNQKQFHQEVESQYQSLADSVKTTLNGALKESGKLTGESIRPIVSETMAKLIEHSNEAQQQLVKDNQDQVNEILNQMATTSKQVSSIWQESIEQHANQSQDMVSDIGKSVSAMQDNFANATQDLMTSLKAAEQQTFEELRGSVAESNEQANRKYEQLSTEYLEKLTSVVSSQQNQQADFVETLKGSSAEMAESWNAMANNLQQQQAELADNFKLAVEDLTDVSHDKATQLLADIQRLTEQSQALVDARIATENQWKEEESKRAEVFSTALKSHLDDMAQRDEQRIANIVSQLNGLEETAANHLLKLGESLEAPMKRLIETASETPKAAADVIEKLREEISKNIEKDNHLLEERRTMMTELSELFADLEKTSISQKEAIESLVSQSTSMMKEVSEHFASQVNSEVTNMNEIVDQVSAGAADLSALSESFTTAVQLYSESNQSLVENLTSIEDALENSNARSDEQLAYYVSQAREIIDHSMMSQKEILEEMRQLGRQPDLFAVEAE